MDIILVDCTWNEWTQGPCSVTCGEGSQINVRQKNPAMFNGTECDGEATETVICKLEDCPGKIWIEEFVIIADD